MKIIKPSIFYLLMSILILTSFGHVKMVQGEILWDYSPEATNGNGTKNWTNESSGQNFAERISFTKDVQINGMDVYSWNLSGASVGDAVTIRLWTEVAGAPDQLIQEFAETISIIDLNGVGTISGIDRKHADFSNPIALSANTFYWIGMSGTPSIEQMGFSINPPEDARMAMFNGTTFVGMPLVGDMAFRLYGTVVSDGKIQNPDNGHYYQLVEVHPGLNWYEAKDSAEAMGHGGMQGHLATLTSPEEEGFVVSNFPQIVPNYVWLGASDEAVEGTWKWMTSEPWSYTNWDPGEPNGGTFENCLDYSNGVDKWNDENCGRKLNFYLVEYDSVATQLIYYDDFNAGGFEENWTKRGAITIVGGRVQSTENGTYIETTQEFTGNLRIEVDVEKVGNSNHTCWDFAIELRELDEAAGIIRFDYDGIDGVAIGCDPDLGCEKCGEDVSIPSSGVNRGKAILTYADSYISFSFINDDGDVLDAGSVYAGQFDSSRIRIYLAAHSDTPRYVDNVRVYSLREPTPTESLLNIVAYLDGRSQLVIKGNEAKWYHLDFAAPGRHMGRDDPTFLNGVPFYPEWPEPGENRWCNCFSSTFTDLSPPLPSDGKPVHLEIFRARHSVEIIQQPTAANDYELVIEFDDNPPGGSDWYSIEVYRPENAPPEAICKDVTVPTEPGTCTADASVDDGSFDPDGDPITLEQTPPGPYALGDTDVTLTVTDDKGLSDQCSATVTVVDQEAPVISSVSATPNVLWPPNHKMVPVALAVDATDNCDSACQNHKMVPEVLVSDATNDCESACQITSISSNEPVGKNAPDWRITGDLTVYLRAERYGKGHGRKYTITVECTDASGNSSTDTAKVILPHDKGKKKGEKKGKK